MKTLPINLALLTLVWAATPALQAADLGDPAPALQIAEWVKGQPVNLAVGKGRTVFVVEFWATWCPPCRASIPHLTELQAKFKAKGVVFVGVSDEKAATVKKFVEKMGPKMDYVVAIDKDRKTSEGYMEAFGINGIPHAFVVNREGQIVWHGHPMGDLEKTLEQLLAGKFDLAKAKKRLQAQKLLEEFQELAAKDEDEAKVIRLARELEALDKELDGIAPGEKFDAAAARQSARFRTAVVEYQRAVFSGKDTAEVEKLAQRAEALAPKDFEFAEFKKNLQFQRLFQDYYKAVTGRGDEAKVAELARQLRTAESKNAMLLNEIAWALLTDEKIKNRDLKLAMKIAQDAYTACEGKMGAIVDTYARALFDTGKVDDAIAYQKKAIELANDEEQRQEMEATLATYQKKAGKKK